MWFHVLLESVPSNSSIATVGKSHLIDSMMDSNVFIVKLFATSVMPMHAHSRICMSTERMYTSTDCMHGGRAHVHKVQVYGHNLHAHERKAPVRIHTLNKCLVA